MHFKILNFQLKISLNVICGFLLRLVNTYTVDIKEYYPRCYKVNDAKAFKIPVVSFYALHSKILYLLGLLNGAFKNPVYLVLCIIGSN